MYMSQKFYVLPFRYTTIIFTRRNNFSHVKNGTAQIFIENNKN